MTDGEQSEASERRERRGSGCQEERDGKGPEGDQSSEAGETKKEGE